MCRVLLAEDDAAISLLLAEVLRGMGHRVCAIESTTLGLWNAAIQTKPDLMIVDVQLSDGDSIDTVAEIMRRGYIPHIYMSGRPMYLDSITDVLLYKPFSESDLARGISRASRYNFKALI